MTELTDYRIYFRGYGIHLPDIHKKHIIEQVCEDYHKKLMEVGYLSPEQVEEKLREIPFKRTTIGPERSMPEKTEIWFITKEELEALKEPDK